MHPSVTPHYSPNAAERSALDATPGTVLLQFGVNWCGHCVAAEPTIVQALQAYPQLQRLCVEDGPGRALGRSFKIKLWPTLVLLHEGRELARLVRPTRVEEVQDFLRQLPAGAP